jgi:hypothetical protein
MESLAARVTELSTSRKVWIDLGNLTHVMSGRDVAEMMHVARRAIGSRNDVVIPVVRTSSGESVIEAGFEWARQGGCGLCVRVDGLTRLREKSVVVDNLIRASRLPVQMVDLIADAQDLPRVASHEELAVAFPVAQECRTWAVVAGSFPDQITHLSPEQYEHRIERSEWSVFEVEMRRTAEWRRPLYGDYATQAPTYSPSPPFPGSPSVRYTLGDAFAILRGRGGPSIDYTQYIGHARYLSTQPYFGEITSGFPENYVTQIAIGNSGTGNPTTWRVASLHRHVQVVGAQVGAMVRARA